jgi:hypothetical protein
LIFCMNCCSCREVCSSEDIVMLSNQVEPVLLAIHCRIAEGADKRHEKTIFNIKVVSLFRLFP